MKLKKTASGKTTIKMSRLEWTKMGSKAGWIKEADMNQLMEIMIKFEKGVDAAVMDGRDVTSLLEELKEVIKEEGLEEDYQRHGAPHIDMIIERAKQKANKYSEEGTFGLFNEGRGFQQGWAIGRDDFGDPKFGPEEHAITFPSFAEAESAAIEFDFGLEVKKIHNL